MVRGRERRYDTLPLPVFPDLRTSSPRSRQGEGVRGRGTQRDGILPRLTERTLPVQLRLHVPGVALRADAVRELRIEAPLQVVVERLPLVPLIANALAVGTDREQRFELVQLLPQSEDPLGDGEAGPQLVRIDRLGDEVVGASVHTGQILLLAALRSDED